MKGHPTYYMLSDDELWERIKILENKVVKSIVQGVESRINKVLDNRVDIRGKNPIYKKEILKAYHQLFSDGKFVQYENHYSLVCAILWKAVPEQIEPYKSKKGLDKGKSGLKIKTFDWAHSLSKPERLELFWDLVTAIEKGDANSIKELIESWEETIEIMSVKKLMKELKQAEKGYGAGDIIPWKKVKKALNL